MEKKNIKMDPDTYLANLNSKKLASIHSNSIDFEKKFGSDGQLRELCPWADKKAKIPAAVDIMIKKKKDAQ